MFPHQWYCSVVLRMYLTDLIKLKSTLVFMLGFFFFSKGWNLPMKETKLMASRIRIDLTSVLEVLCLHPPKIPEKSLCPKLLRAKKYLAVLSVRWMGFFLLLSNTSVSEPCSLSEEWMRGHKYSPALTNGSEPWRESLFPLTVCQKPLSCQNTTDEFTNSRVTFPHICGQVINCNRPAKGWMITTGGSQLLSWVSLNSLLLQLSLSMLVIKWAE